MDIRELKVGDPVTRIYGGRFSTASGVEFGAVVKVTKTRVTAKFGDRDRVYSMRNRPWGETSAGGWISHSTDYIDTPAAGQRVADALRARNARIALICRANLEDIDTRLRRILLNSSIAEGDWLLELAALMRSAASVLEGKE